MILTELPTPITPTDVMTEMLSEAKVNVTLASSMIAYQMYRCEFEWIENHILKTAGAVVTPERNIIYLDKHFFCDRLENAKQRAFIILHEVLHIFLNHGERQLSQGYNDTIWGYATDFNINITARGVYGDGRNIKTNPRYEKYVEMPPMGLYDTKWIGMSADEIYHKIIEEAGGLPEALDALGDGDVGDAGSPIDYVFQPEGDTTNQEAKNLQAAIASSAHAIETKSIGDNEAWMVKHFRQMATPVVVWTERIQTRINNSLRDYPTYKRLSRRSSEVCFPSHEGVAATVFFGIDTSGSMSQDDYTRAAGELKGVCEQFDSWKVLLYTCDTRPHLIGVYTSEDDDDFIDDGIKLIGGGGTSFKSLVVECIDLIEEGEDINAFILLTDGHIPNDIDGLGLQCDGIVVVTENGNDKLELNDFEVIKVNKK